MKFTSAFASAALSLVSIASAQQAQVTTIYRYVNATATIYQNYCPCAATGTPGLVAGNNGAVSGTGAAIPGSSSGSGASAPGTSSGSDASAPGTSSGSGASAPGTSSGSGAAPAADAGGNGAAVAPGSGSAPSTPGGAAVAPGSGAAAVPVVQTYQTIIVSYTTSLIFNTYTTTLYPAGRATVTSVVTDTTTVTVPVTATATVTTTVANGAGVAPGQTSLGGSSTAPFSNSTMSSTVSSGSVSVTGTSSSVSVTGTSSSVAPTGTNVAAAIATAAPCSFFTYTIPASVVPLDGQITQAAYDTAAAPWLTFDANTRTFSGFVPCTSTSSSLVTSTSTVLARRKRAAEFVLTVIITYVRNGITQQVRIDIVLPGGSAVATSTTVATATSSTSSVSVGSAPASTTTGSVASSSSAPSISVSLPTGSSSSISVSVPTGSSSSLSVSVPTGSSTSLSVSVPTGSSSSISVSVPTGSSSSLSVSVPTGSSSSLSVSVPTVSSSSISASLPTGSSSSVSSSSVLYSNSSSTVSAPTVSVPSVSLSTSISTTVSVPSTSGSSTVSASTSTTVSVPSTSGSSTVSAPTSISTSLSSSVSASSTVSSSSSKVLPPLYTPTATVNMIALDSSPYYNNVYLASPGLQPAFYNNGGLDYVPAATSTFNYVFTVNDTSATTELWFVNGGTSTKLGYQIAATGAGNGAPFALVDAHEIDGETYQTRFAVVTLNGRQAIAAPTAIQFYFESSTGGNLYAASTSLDVSGNIYQGSASFSAFESLEFLTVDGTTSPDPPEAQPQ